MHSKAINSSRVKVDEYQLLTDKYKVLSDMSSR